MTTSTAPEPHLTTAPEPTPGERLAGFGLPGIEGRTALVTGGGAGIGEITASLLHALGARVAILDVDGAAAERVAAAHPGMLAITARVDDAQAVDRAFSTVEGELGGVQLLVNNAGIVGRAKLHEYDDDEFDRVLGVNLRGVYLCAKRHAQERIFSGQGGAVVNVASLSHRGMTQQIAYASSKGGVVSLTKSAALELARHGVRVNAVAPGMTETAMGEGEGLRERMLRAIPLRRYATPPEIAWPIAFLLSDAASYVTGEVVPVGGGGRL